MVLALISLAALVAVAYAQTTTFTAEELLGKPTDTSVTINIVPASGIQYYYEYGTTSGDYTAETSPVSATGGQPSEVTVQGLSPDTLYYYRMVYDADGSVTDGDAETRPQHTFRTQRAEGEPFAFTVTSDIHNSLTTLYANVMTNVLNEQPDFHIDLGDTFLTDGAGSESAARERYANHRGTSYMGKIGSSIPIFLATGNHEDEEGWNLDDTGSNATGIWNINARKDYFPTPSGADAGGFYSGNDDPLAAIGGDRQREDYYAWTWGDALFVVIDEFQYTMNLPYSPTAGELSGESVTGDQWNWTLGREQYDWLTSTLEGSDARYKFVFSHNMLGGVPRTVSGVGAGYVRGGAEAAAYFEWGGYEADGTTWGFDDHRPGWDKPIHQLFVDTGVSAYFHGHDHQYVYEERDGVVYQEVPSGAGMSGGFGGIYTEGDHGDYQTIEQQQTGTGHLLISVGEDDATVDYISSSATPAVNYTYDIDPSEPSDTPNITVTGSLSAFSSLPGTPSAQKSYSVSGSNLTAGIEITAPADFQISTTSGSGWTSSLTLPQSGGTVSSTPVYVRFNRATEGTSSGNIVHSSAGATTRNQAVNGTAAEPSGDPITFTGEELLGRPTDASVSVKVVPDEAISLYYEYGTASGAYTQQTATETAAADQPKTMAIDGLAADTRYFYRMKYSSDGGSTWVTRDQHSFWTQRAEGSTFTFDITTDGHVGIQLGNASNWQSTLNGVAYDAPDFLVELGDTVAMDAGSGGSIPEGDTAAAEDVYKDVLPYFNTVSGSAPIFLLPGNHEQQEAWHGTAAGDLPIMSKNAEKKYFLNPVPGAFYGGNARTLPALSDDQLVQDYYSWTWGDALFVVINPFWTTTTKPYTTTVGGGETDTTGSGDRWDWTLGLDQFNWLKSTLAGSDAKYKFVFSHQIVGGNSMSNQVNYGHGGIDSANFVEWGGYDTNGTTWAWDTERPGWGSQPIRQMMEASGVTAFFHGHDHQMAYETANGMVCQAVPSGSFSGSFGNYTTGNSYTVRDSSGGTSVGQTVWADSTQGPGHLRVTVAPDEAEVEFVRYNQTSTAAYSYTMAPTGGSEVTHTLTYTPGAHGSVSGISPQTVVDGEDGSEVEAIADSGYHFVQWSDGVTTASRTDTNVTADISVTAQFAADPAAVTVDGSPTSDTGAATATDLSFTHTTGTGADRLMLVGVSWNCGNTNRTISSVTFTPSGGSAASLTPVITQLGYSSTNPRYSAIYSLLNPPSGVTGTVAVTFSGAVSNGSVAGAACFAGVDQATPLGTPAGAGTTDNALTCSVGLTAGLDGDELIFDNVFAGASSISQTLTPSSGQTARWNVLNYVSSPATNIIAAASTRQATGTSASMSWTAASSTRWAIAAVPINPAPAGLTHDLTVSVSPSGGGTTAPAVGAHTYPEGTVVDITATPNSGYVFDHWTGDVTDSESASTTVTVSADKTVTAHFVAEEYTLTIDIVGQGTVAKDPDQATYHYGDQVSLTAIPAGGHVFAGWSGDLADGVNPQSVTMNGDKTITATFEQYVPMPLGVDGASSSGTRAADATSVSFSHTTGTGSDRLMLVGVSWNCGSTDRTVSSVTLTPLGGSAIPLAVVTEQETTGTADRHSAIYRLLDPPKGVSGTVTVTFSGAVSNGIVAGAVNFAGVDQDDPLGTAAGASGNSTGAGVTLTGLDGDELVFDNVFQGASSESQTLTPVAGRTVHWNAFTSNTRAAASTAEAGGGSVAMTWTAASSSYWAIAAVPINPATTTPYDAETPQISGQPADVSVIAGGSAIVSVTATVSKGTLSYQWFSNTTRSNTGGTPIAGATEDSYAAPTSAPGTTYYYCVVTNTDDEATGNQTATATSDAAKVQVNAIDLSGATIAPIADQTYAGSAITPAVTVTLGGVTLAQGIDYAVAYENNVNVGAATATVTGTGKYAGSVPAGFAIVPATPEVTIWPTASPITIGQALSDSVLTGGEASVSGAFAFTTPGYEPLISGLCGVSFTPGNSNYSAVTGSVWVEVSALADAETPVITDEPNDVSVNIAGSATLSVTATVSKGTLSYQWFSNTIRSNTGGESVDGATDDTFIAPTNLAGTTYYYCVVTNTDDEATGNQTATATSDAAKVEVNALTDAETPDITQQSANVSVGVGGPATLSVDVTVGRGVLSWQWYSNTIPSKDVSTATLIKGATGSTYDAPTSVPGTTYYFCVVTNTDDEATGNQTAIAVSEPTQVKVDAIDLSGATIASIPDQTYAGSAITPAVTVTLGGVTLAQDTDYAVAYENNVNVGAATVTVTGRGLWTGSKTATFQIKAKSIASARVAQIANRVFTGRAIEPAVTVDLDGTILKTGTDYTLTYSSNTLSGKATVTVTGAGNYSGTTTATFKIVPKKSAISKLKAGSGRFTATWKKHSGASGYQVAYSRKKAGVFKTLSGASASRTVKGLKHGKVYHVKVRAYITIDGKRYYGAWSNVRNVLVR